MSKQRKPYWFLLAAGFGLTALQSIDVFASETGSKEWIYETAGLVIPLVMIGVAVWFLWRLRTPMPEGEDDESAADADGTDNPVGG